jgi:hypothetical protein
MNNNFFKDLPSYDSINNLSQDIYAPMADDWHILSTDVKGSTKAIEEGKYKDINFLGALAIISLININNSIELPFIFGGDGSLILIPPSILNEAQQALLHITQIAHKEYNLDLRVVSIPVKQLYLDEKPLYIAKTKVSEDYNQALLKGEGAEYIDTLMKNDDRFHIDQEFDKTYKLKTEGLECRWSSIPSSKDYTLSIIIKCKEHIYYQNVLEQLDLILGDKFHRHPITKDNLQLSFNTDELSSETKLKSHNPLNQFLTILKFKFINLIGLFFMFFKINKWAHYKQRVIASSDTEKFDDTLRMVVVTNKTQLKELESYLEKEYKNHHLYYGIHKADSALITCLIFQRHGKHIHFVDSSNGGYAYAAKQLKNQRNN